MKRYESRKIARSSQRPYFIFVKLSAGSILVFSLLYKLSFASYPLLTTARLALPLFTLFCWQLLLKCLSRELCGIHPRYYLILFFLFLHAMLTYLLGGVGDSTQLSRITNYLLYAIVGGMLLAVFLEFNMKWVAISILCAILIQSFFIILEMSNMQFHSWVVRALMDGSAQLDLARTSRAIGLSKVSGSHLAVTQALGVFLSFLLLFKANTKIGRNLLYISVIPLILSTIFTGRTGTLIAVLFIVGFFVVGKVKNKLFLIGILGIMLVITILGWDYLLPALAELNSDIYYIINWQTELLHLSESTTLKSLMMMNIPELSFDTLFGTGLVFDGLLNYSGSDSGYIQNYYSLGLILSLIFYISTLLLFASAFLKIDDNEVSLYLIIGLGVMFFIEVKEPYIFKYNYPMVLFALMFCSQKKLYSRHSH